MSGRKEPRKIKQSNATWLKPMSSERRSTQAAPELLLRLKKGPDGRIASFALHRRDGSVTVQRNLQDFFPAHDLTHYAVETTLGFDHAFYGHVADGWDFGDFGAPWPRGRMEGSEVVMVEHLVGFLDLERASGTLFTANELRDLLRERGFESTLTDAELSHVRETRERLVMRLRELGPGETFELPYSRSNLAHG